MATILFVVDIGAMGSHQNTVGRIGASLKPKMTLRKLGIGEHPVDKSRVLLKAGRC